MIGTLLCSARRFVPPFLALAFLLPGLSLSAQRGALVQQRNLFELVNQAESVVVGRVVSARLEKHPEFQNLDTVVVTLQVDDTWKGTAGPTLTFRQYVWDIRDKANRLGYRKGQQILLLLNRPSEYGLTSPAGVDQGRFRLLEDARGRRLALNGVGNRGLFFEMRDPLRRERIELSSSASLLVETHRQGPIALADLKNLVRQMVRER